LFVTRCLADPKFATHGERLLPALQSVAKSSHNMDYMTRLRILSDGLAATKAGAANAIAAAVPPRWHSATHGSVWLAHDGYLVDAANDQPSFLLFDVPLAGTFEFSVDAWQGQFTEGHIGYGGVVFEPNRTNGGSTVWSVGKQDLIQRMAEKLRIDQFNRLTVQVAPGKVRCLVNGHLFYEDTDPPPTSPWAM